MNHKIRNKTHRIWYKLIFVIIAIAWASSYYLIKEFFKSEQKHGEKILLTLVENRISNSPSYRY